MHLCAALAHVAASADEPELKSPKAPSRSKWLSEIRAEIASFSPPKVGLTGQMTLTA
jgi:hypothetical protein